MITPETILIGLVGWVTIELIALPFSVRALRKMRKQIADAKRDATQWQNEANAKSNTATNAKAELKHYSKQLSDAEGTIYEQKVEMRGYIKALHDIAAVAHVDKNSNIHVRGKKTGRFTPVKFNFTEKA